LKVSFTIADIAVAQYAKILNDATVTATGAGAGVAGQSDIDLLQGFTPPLYAMIIRGEESAFGDGFASHYQIPICYQSANPTPVFKKGEPASLECEFTALWDSTLGFGKYVSQSAAAS